MKITAENYYTLTISNFKSVKNMAATLKKLGKPNVVTSSSYWITDLGLYRLSDHWGSYINTCSWYIDYKVSDKGNKLGFVSWDEIYTKDILEKDRISPKPNKRGYKTYLKIENFVKKEFEKKDLYYSAPKNSGKENSKYGIRELHVMRDIALLKNVNSL